MARKTFNGIKDSITNTLASEEQALKAVARRIGLFKEDIDPETLEFLYSELKSIDLKIRETANQVSRLYERAVLDVTGLYTKAYLTDYLQEHEQSDARFAFLMSDIDKFHDYNVAYGHLQGDVALEAVAQSFKNSIEGRLNPEEVPFTARFGGEEFCSFIEYYAGDIPLLGNIAQEVRVAVQSLEIGIYPGNRASDDGYKNSTITIACGIRRENEPLGTLVKRVNDELKRKECDGRNRVYLAR